MEPRAADPAGRLLGCEIGSQMIVDFAKGSFMADGARFVPVKGKPDELHWQHHGGRVVDLVFRIVDHRSASKPRRRTLSRRWPAFFTRTKLRLAHSRDGP
jgi:hypothetical protein